MITTDFWVPYAYKSFAVRCTSGGDNTLVAAVTGKKITVISLVVHLEKAAAGNVVVVWKSGSTAISQRFSFGPGEGIVEPLGTILPYIMQTAAGEALIANLSATYATRISGTYIEV